jgi:cellulose synthase/poly-beta-1,6-N-acetylglucosamine synthase-like glycosyltransferase
MESINTAKRNILGTRLEMSKLCTFLGKDPWTGSANAAYESCHPSVTVIITLYNYADYIQQCLDSVCASQSIDFDILVIDDCSTDDSAAIVQDYLQTTETPIRLIQKAFNTGLADARNTGLHLARAPFVFILDADNWIYPNCLTTLHSAIQTAGCAAVYGIINRFNSKTGEGAGLVSFYEWDVLELVAGPYIDAMALFKKDILLKVGGYSTELMVIAWSGWEDYDLWLKLAQAGHNAKLVPNILSSYRVHPNSMIHTTNAYSDILVEYFRKKFSLLIEQHDDLEVCFGQPRDHRPSAIPTATQLKETQEKLQRARRNLERTKAELAQTKDQLAAAQDRITAMETSKFWRIRRRWFRVRQILRLPTNE